MRTKDIYFSFKLLLAFLLLTSCSFTSKKLPLNNDSLAVNLNDSAVKIVQIGFGSDESYAKAVALLDSATTLKPDYLIAYGNKADFLLKLGKCEVALNTLDTLLKYQQNDPVVLTKKAFFLDKCFGNDRSDEVEKNLQTAASIFYTRYEKDGSIADFKNFIFNTLFTKGREQAILALEKEKGNFIKDDASQNDFNNFRNYLTTININDYLANSKRPLD